MFSCEFYEISKNTYFTEQIFGEYSIVCCSWRKISALEVDGAYSFFVYLLLFFLFCFPLKITCSSMSFYKLSVQLIYLFIYF